MKIDVFGLPRCSGASALPRLVNPVKDGDALTASHEG
jgi:hypothetical protein